MEKEKNPNLSYQKNTVVLIDDRQKIFKAINLIHITPIISVKSWYVIYLNIS